MKTIIAAAVACCAVLTAPVPWRASAQAPGPRRVEGPPGASGEWRHYAGDLRNHHYSPLDQISASNFNGLQIAWRLKTDNLGTRPEYKLEGTPLMVRGVLYATAGSRRAVVALDAATGEILWIHGYPEGARGAAAPRQLSGRGLAYWTDGKEERILYFTPGYRLIALNAKTGMRIPSFGRDGIVDLKLDFDQQIDLVTGEVGLHSTPAIAGDLVIVGAAFREGQTPKTHNNTRGYVRAFDVRTGKRAWIFQPSRGPANSGTTRG
jgi:quinoprotein glucose dehydrogenase